MFSWIDKPAGIAGPPVPGTLSENTPGKRESYGITGERGDPFRVPRKPAGPGTHQDLCFFAKNPHSSHVLSDAVKDHTITGVDAAIVSEDGRVRHHRSSDRKKRRLHHRRVPRSQSGARPSGTPLLPDVCLTTLRTPTFLSSRLPLERLRKNTQIRSMI